ncbi:hypothetical protein NIES2107_11210 [Nostoc carneum NIES-2107]|nr:hypothetical protein NIES2107_11210 [Nostoc carneum NIES-2107]
MSIQPPKIDKRTYEEIVEKTVKLVQYYTAQENSELVDNKAEFLRDRILAEDITNTEGNIIKAGTLIDGIIADAIAKVKGLEKINVKLKGWWKPDKPDAGLALIRIFGRMAATVSDRLNRVPEKNFLAFLDLLGTQILPPQPARVPLTFSLASGLPENTTALIPAYTQISAPPTEGEEEEVVFETESDVLITPVQLQAVFVRNLETDKYSECLRHGFAERTLTATGRQDTAFLAFEADTAIEHSLYLACEQVFSLSEIKTVRLNIYSSQVTDLNNLPITWSYWNGINWKTLESENKTESDHLQVTLKNLPDFPLRTVNEISAKWLKATVINRSDLSVKRITTSVDITDSKLKLDQCFFNTVPLDLNKDFYPFGEQPHFNDTFYLGSQEIFSKPDFTVKFKVKISENVKDDGGVEIAWEFYNGLNWEEIEKSRANNSDIADNSALEESKQNFNDDTNAFTKPGKITLKIPNTIKPVTINGINNYWLRARIVKGNYGTEATYRQREKNGQPLYVNEVPIYELVAATFAPPCIQSISLEYSSPDVPLSNCLSYKNFIYQVYSTNFQPFVKTTNEDTKPTLYMGFDRPFPNRAIALYFQVEPPTAQELATATINVEKPILVWEYFNGKIWIKLSVIDETAALSERGLIKFIGPSDFTATQEFNQTLYWLRVRWEKGHFQVKPRLRRILTNTIWASQATTLQNEILGFSNGNPNQTFRTVKSPILPDQQLEIQEQKIPSLEEQIAIEKLEGKDAITIIRDEKGDVETVWVRWHEVSDFYQSGMRDRHYTINRLTGEIKFGDGQQGMIPPQGRNNIRMTRYKTDGGVKGNKPAQTITQLKTSIPFINSVTNLEPAGSGADREPIERVKERGPKFIRHRNRAVTAQDFEDLAYEASPDVARAKAIAPVFNPLADDSWLETNRDLTKNPSEIHLKPDINPGQVTLLIVPKSSARQPVPSLALIERVETYIRARCHPTINLIVTAPDWQQVSVTAVVVPVSPDVADAATEAVIKRLEEFLHPLTGGKQGQGWAFGRQPQMSDLYAVIEGVPGVDHIHELSELKVKPLSPKQLVYSGSHTITLLEE